MPTPTNVQTGTSVPARAGFETLGGVALEAENLRLHHLFEAQVDACPNAVAVIQGDTQITYADLDRQANRIAHRLRLDRVGPGARVAILLPRGIDAYAAILGTLKAGAAYVPLDPDYPSARLHYILNDVTADLLITSAELSGLAPDFAGTVMRVDTDAERITTQSDARLPDSGCEDAAGELCYIIYTSGSTGKPKGVMIEHRSVVHLVRAEAGLYGLYRHDRVYQGASLAFDLAVEEIWMAFCAGATLVAATCEMAHAGPDLARMLAQAGVTVLSCVPTLLQMLEDDVACLRLLILGGEACPPALVDRWSRSGRRIVNTYGPTETTVIATWCDLQPGRPVRIGRPLPGYRIYVLDESLQPVPSNGEGEICIGGVGVARGYVNRDAETADRFVPDPFAPPHDQGARLYRSGDLGCLVADAELEFRGRIDGQVKLRGFRVELGEIEAALLRASDVAAAACTVHEVDPGVEQLVAYVVPRSGRTIDDKLLRERLRQGLPAYMVPACIEPLETLPQLPSGKVDRKALPPPRQRVVAQAMGRQPKNGTERLVHEVFSSLFKPQAVGVDDDFFLDLGGHSLLAARAVSALRKQPRYARVSVTDLYEHPSVAKLAAALLAKAAVSPGATPNLAAPQSTWLHPLAGLLQTLGLYVHFGVRGAVTLSPFMLFFWLGSQGMALPAAAGWAAASSLLIAPLLLILALAAKWLLLGRIKAGRHKLWGFYYLRWWFAHQLIALAPIGMLGGTPLAPWIMRLFGARVGRQVQLGTDEIAAYDLIDIGDGSSISDHAAMLGYTVAHGQLIVGPIRIGQNCYVGTHATLQTHTVMENGARLEDQSLLPHGSRIPSDETWAGSPAASVQYPPDRPVPGLTPSRARLATATMFYTVFIMAAPLLGIGAIAPGLMLLQLDPFADSWQYLAAIPLVGALYVMTYALEVLGLKWLLVGRLPAGSYPIHGSIYLRQWMVERLLDMSVALIGPLRATLYLAPWFRALGSRLGRSVELSTALTTAPDLITLDDESTVADEAALGRSHVERGWMTVAPMRLGRRAFVGNSAVVPAGVHVGESSLIGVLSVAPRPDKARRPHAGWLGSPPFRLAHWQASLAFSEKRTYRPTRGLRLARGSFELLRVTLPAAGTILVNVASIDMLMALFGQYGLAVTLALMPLVYVAACFAMLLVVVAAKWLIVGRYRPFEHPLWSFFVWRLELTNALYEFMAVPLALGALRGTPWLPVYLRLLGCHIGRAVYINTTGFLEWDLINVGDRCALNDDCVLQTHLFEDRVLKGSTLKMGKDCRVGEYAIALYDTEMQDQVELDALSLLMKGETLPAGTTWHGIPAVWREAQRGAHAYAYA